ncbi:MAG: YitT family protein, partial [Bacteroidales bacterium]|nr:YitT family protein [Bacteroidales bacterium]
RKSMSSSPILKRSIGTILKEYGMITVGVVSYALGWTIFLLPNNLIGGGVSGFASILYYATGLSMGVTYFIINILLLIIGTRILGTGFGGKTIYAIIMTSVMLSLMPKIIPSDFIHEFALSNGKIICTFLGGIIAGFGIGLSISQGGSTGGTDIIALLWCRFHPASPGRVILIIDVGIIISSLLFPSYTETGELLSFADKLAVVVYGLIQVTVSGYAIDLYLSGSKQSVQAFIFTKKVSEMADAIAFDMKRGVTVIPAKGWYSKEERQVLMVVTRKTDLNLLLRYVKNIDPDAFLSVSTVMGVYGQGFDTIKVKSNKRNVSKLSAE